MAPNNSMLCSLATSVVAYANYFIFLKYFYTSIAVVVQILTNVNIGIVRALNSDYAYQLSLCNIKKW